MTLQQASTTVDVPGGVFGRSPAITSRVLSPVRTAQAKYDGDVLHITMQYPGCDDGRVLGILRARVVWFGRGTLLDRIFAPSLRTVHAAGRRLESAGKIKSKVDQSEDRQVLRFYPNNPVWADPTLKM
jgi:hypothetical protein